MIPPAEARKHALPPIAPPNARLLILGSLPGDASLAAREYYAHPQNAFWRLLGEVTGLPLATLAYPARIAAIEAAGIALWDTIAHAERPGSLDSAIARATDADLPALVASLPMLRAVGLNGRTAHVRGTKALATTRLALIALPSSSAAHTMAYAAKRDAWLALKPWLATPPGA